MNSYILLNSRVIGSGFSVSSVVRFALPCTLYIGLRQKSRLAKTLRCIKPTLLLYKANRESPHLTLLPQFPSSFVYFLLFTLDLKMTSSKPNTDIATRAFVVAWKCPLGGKSSAEIVDFLGISNRQVNRIYAKALERGFDPTARPLHICNQHLEDAPRSGRPKKQTPEIQDAVISKVRQDRRGREKTAVNVAYELSSGGTKISATTILRILNKARSKKTKLTRKSR